MEVNLILVPYHLGQARVGMGRGPERIVQAGLDGELISQGHGVNVKTIRRQAHLEHDEIIAIAEINMLLAKQVCEALDQGSFPLILAGNCNACLGTLAGIEARPVGIIWLDAHGDFNTPETSVSGFLDGMSLAIATGLCHRTIWRQIGGAPIPGSHALHIGGRDFDEREKARLEKHQVGVVPASQLRQIGLAAALRPALAALRSHVEDVYLHLDLDVLDPTEARANEFAAPEGLSLQDLESAIRMVGETFDIKAAALTAYNPAYDELGRALGAGIRLIHTLVDTVARRAHQQEVGS